MIKLAEAGERIAATTKKLEKIAIVAEYLKARTPEEASVSAVFLSGRPFPVWEETTLQVGGRVLWRDRRRAFRKDRSRTDRSLSQARRPWRRRGSRSPALPGPRGDGRPRPSRPGKARRRSADCAQTSPPNSAKSQPPAAPAAKAALARELLSQASPLEAKYIVKIMTGDLRIGLKESLVEEAIAKAYGGTLGEVQRANMLLGDIGETLKLAAGNRLGDAKMRLFHPLGFMLASPAESAEEALSYFRERPGGRQVRRHPRPGALFRRRGSNLLAHPGRDHRVLPRVAGRAGRSAGRCNPRRRDRGVELRRRT